MTRTTPGSKQKYKASPKSVLYSNTTPVSSFHLNFLAMSRLGTVLYGITLLFLCASRAISFEQPLRLAHTAAFIALLLLVAIRVIERFRKKKDVTWLMDIELGILTISCSALIIEILGGMEYGYVIFLFISIYASFARLSSLIITVSLTSAYWISSWILMQQPVLSKQLLVNVALLWLFAFFARILLRTELLRRDYLFKEQINNFIGNVTSDARLFRLTSGRKRESTKTDTQAEQERQLISAVGAVRDGIHNLFKMSQAVFKPPLHSLVLFIIENDQLHIKEAETISNYLVETPLSTGQGVLGVAIKKREIVRLEDLPSRFKGLNYYNGSVQVSAVIVIPIIHDKELIGLLVADKQNDTHFFDQEIGYLEILVQEIVRVMEFEYLFMDLFQQKRAYEKFHKAAGDFNSATSLNQASEAAIKAAIDVSEAEFAAITLRDEENRKDTIIAAYWYSQDIKDIIGRNLWPDSGLVSMAIKLKHPLPEPATITPRQAIFDPSISLKGIRACRIYPLLWNERAIGTLTVAGSNPHFLTPQVRDMLEVIADQTAISIANATLYEKLQTMATTDGLTGLINHRHFQERLKDSFHRCARYRRNLSLVLIDIDHFKTVNDTYGHPVGDLVLQRVSQSLVDTSRKTDIVARYGGEEFAVVMEETDWAGALRIAERIREAVSREIFRTKHGTFRCTLSIGVATYPEHVKERTELISSADQALYHAKNTGRDKTVVAGFQKKSSSKNMQAN